MKMENAIFTSFTFSYLAQARVLARTVKKYCPNYMLIAIISDSAPPGVNVKEVLRCFDEVYYITDIEKCQSPSWIFKHTIVELCTAVKPFFFDFLFERFNFSYVIYLDPDIALFSDLSEIEDALKHASVILTPHQTSPANTQRSIRDNEISSLKHGIYNLGFIAIKNDQCGNRALSWWCDRLSSYCYDALDEGIFVDQKWCDLMPALFPGVCILRSPSLNVACWNIENRNIKFSYDGELLCENNPLVFFHFTKIGHVGANMLQSYLGDNIEVLELYYWYLRELQKNFDPSIPKDWWYYGKFTNGLAITKEMRLLFRKRKDLQDYFVNPFTFEEEKSYLAWWINNNVNAT